MACCCETFWKTCLGIFFQEDYAPLSIMFYKLEIGKHKSNSTMPRHKYSKVFKEFCKYVLKDASMTPKINPFGWHHSANIRFISSTQYWKRILKFTITNTECLCWTIYNKTLQSLLIHVHLLPRNPSFTLCCVHKSKNAGHFWNLPCIMHSLLIWWYR